MCPIRTKFKSQVGYDPDDEPYYQYYNEKGLISQELTLETRDERGVIGTINLTSILSSVNF